MDKEKPNWPWREHLTDAERTALDDADKAKAAWEELNRGRAQIVNRAIQRARYAAGVR